MKIEEVLIDIMSVGAKADSCLKIINSTLEKIDWNFIPSTESNLDVMGNNFKKLPLIIQLSEKLTGRNASHSKVWLEVFYVALKDIESWSEATKSACFAHFFGGDKEIVGISEEDYKNLLNRLSAVLGDILINPAALGNSISMDNIVLANKLIDMGCEVDTRIRASLGTYPNSVDIMVPLVLAVQSPKLLSKMMNCGAQCDVEILTTDGRSSDFSVLSAAISLYAGKDRVWNFGENPEQCLELVIKTIMDRKKEEERERIALGLISFQLKQFKARDSFQKGMKAQTLVLEPLIKYLPMNYRECGFYGLSLAQEVGAFYGHKKAKELSESLGISNEELSIKNKYGLTAVDYMMMNEWYAAYRYRGVTDKDKKEDKFFRKEVARFWNDFSEDKFRKMKSELIRLKECAPDLARGVNMSLFIGEVLDVSNYEPPKLGESLLGYMFCDVLKVKSEEDWNSKVEPRLKEIYEIINKVDYETSLVEQIKMMRLAGREVNFGWAINGLGCTWYGKADVKDEMVQAIRNIIKNVLSNILNTDDDWKKMSPAAIIDLEKILTKHPLSWKVFMEEIDGEFKGHWAGRLQGHFSQEHEYMKQAKILGEKILLKTSVGVAEGKKYMPSAL